MLPSTWHIDTIKLLLLLSLLKLLMIILLLNAHSNVHAIHVNSPAIHLKVLPSVLETSFFNRVLFLLHNGVTASIWSWFLITQLPIYWDSWGNLYNLKSLYNRFTHLWHSYWRFDPEQNGDMKPKFCFIVPVEIYVNNLYFYGF